MSEIKLDVIGYDKKKKKKKKHDADSLLGDLDVIESSGDVMSISAFRPKKESKKYEDPTVPDDDADEWLSTLATFKQEPIKASRARGSSGLFDYDGSSNKGRRKKKKGKRMDEGPDYTKEFEPEIGILHNILEEQLRFTGSLQRRYDTLESTKSAARGVGKFTTDLITAINQGRQTSLQTVNSIVSAKKTIADLKMKAAKERAGIDGDTEDLGNYSAHLLKKIISQSKNDLLAYGGDVVPVDGDADDLFAGIERTLADEEERPEEVEKYMQYGTDVEMYAVIDKATNDYTFEAHNRITGEVIDDYPLPTVSKLDINESTGMASDEWYTKYPIIWK